MWCSGDSGDSSGDSTDGGGDSGVVLCVMLVQCWCGALCEVRAMLVWWVLV
jgi:hypothetical protein